MTRREMFFSGLVMLPSQWPSRDHIDLPDWMHDPLAREREEQRHAAEAQADFVQVVNEFANAWDKLFKAYVATNVWDVSQCSKVTRLFHDLEKHSAWLTREKLKHRK